MAREIRPDGRVDLVSRFMRFRDGEFLVLTARVPKADLPATLAVRDHVRRTADGFEIVPLTTRRLHQEKLLRRARRALVEPPASATPIDRARYRLDLVAFLHARGYFGAVRRPT